MCAALLLIVLFGLELHGARSLCQTIDEGAHIGAGYSYRKTGDFRLNPEHPPLMKLLAGLPIIFLPIDQSIFQSDAWHASDQWGFGYALLYDSGVSHTTILWLARLPLMLSSVLLAWLVFKWTRNSFSPAAALFALTLLVFDPNIIAHGSLATNDVLTTLLFFASCLSFWRFLEHQTWQRGLGASVCIALTALTKFTGLTLFPILAIVAVVVRLHEASPMHTLPHISLKRMIAFFGGALGVFALVMWVLYGFELTRPLRDPSLQAALNRARAAHESGLGANQPQPIPTLYPLLFEDGAASRVIWWTLENVPIPAYRFFFGFGSFLNHQIFGHRAYLHGAEQEGGFVQYFPLAFLWKTPMATLLLLFVGIVAAGSLYFRTFGLRLRLKQVFLTIPTQYFILLIPPILFFLSTLTSRINIGHRHILVVYPFLYVLLGALFTLPLQHKMQTVFRALLLTMVAISAAFIVSIHPFELSYMNELVGGPTRGYEYLLDSNYDWGQGLPRVAEYMKENHLETVYLSYFGNAKPEAYGIQYARLPKDPSTFEQEQLHGTAIASITHLVTDEEYFWLRNYPIVARIGYNLVVFKLE